MLERYEKGAGPMYKGTDIYPQLCKYSSHLCPTFWVLEDMEPGVGSMFSVFCPCSCLYACNQLELEETTF